MKISAQDLDFRQGWDANDTKVGPLLSRDAPASPATQFSDTDRYQILTKSESDACRGVGSLVSAARGWLGTPYHDQASLRGVGCDCLGLARGVWREVVGAESFPIPSYSRDWGETGRCEVLAEGVRRMMSEIAPTDAVPGALILFRMTPRAIAKHVGILTSADSFIHAYERLGVIEEVLTPTWRRRIAFAFLFPQS